MHKACCHTVPPPPRPPQTHLGNSVAFDVFMPGLVAAAEDARALGVAATYIMCFRKDLSEESALETLVRRLAVGAVGAVGGMVVGTVRTDGQSDADLPACWGTVL